MNNKLIPLIAVFIALVAAAGCMGFPNAGFDLSSASQDISTGRVPSESRIAYAGEAASAPIPTSALSEPGSGISGIDSKIIKTAYLSIEVEDVFGSIETLKNLASQKGGYLSSTNIQKNYNDRLSGSVIIRVPAAEFENTLTGVRALGTVRSASTQGQDVTEEYVDLQAQKNSYQNQLAQYNEIMKKAVKVEDVITVQQQIDRVQTELNRLEGRLKYLDSRIDLSTITVNLQEPEPVGGETGHNFVSTMNEGIAGFFGMIDAIIILVFTLLPLILLGGAGYAIYRWRKGRKGTAPPDLSEKK
jgi:multidrug efflux pump subunit AcrA (membrane-fusion protein)